MNQTEKLKTAEAIIEESIRFGGFVYGGYVRDVLLDNRNDFTDLDLYIPQHEIFDFIWTLGSRGIQIIRGQSIESAPSLFTFGDDYPWRRIKCMCMGIQLDICARKPTIQHYDFNVNAAYYNGAISSLFHSRSTLLTIASCVAAKTAYWLNDPSKFPDKTQGHMLRRADVMRKKGYQIKFSEEMFKQQTNFF